MRNSYKNDAILTIFSVSPCKVLRVALYVTQGVGAKRPQKECMGLFCLPQLKRAEVRA